MHETTRRQSVLAKPVMPLEAPVAYVKSVDQDGSMVYSIHGDDGRLLAVASTRDLAFAIIRKNDLEPRDVH